MPMKHLAIVALLLSGSALAGPVYKWVDEKGRTHYSDKPVASAKKLEVKAPGAAQAAKDAANADETEGARARNCQQKKDQLLTYKNAASVKEVDSLGNEKEFTADEKVKLIERTQQQISQLCEAQTAAEGS